MHSLYHALLAQHPRQLTAMRCASSTIAQLHRYFEDVVLENNLGALLIESLPTVKERSASEFHRVNDLVEAARSVFLFATADDALNRLMLARGKKIKEAVVVGQDFASERFVVIADARFSALLASVTDSEDKGNGVGDLVVWTFEPDVVYSALEYLMARMTAEHPFQATSFASAVRVSMPKATSLQLTLSVTTKLARLLQEQAEREIAVNRIATAIRNSFELDSLLATAVNEVGRALNVKCCAVQVKDELIGQTMTRYYFRSETDVKEGTERQLLADIEWMRNSVPSSATTWVIDGDDSNLQTIFARAAVPLLYNGDFVGLLLVQTDDSSRVWAQNEVLLLHTVADQLTVAVRQAHLFAQTQRQALTDELTGCFNRRSFEIQLERDLYMATRLGQPLSLIMIDLDNFKEINDQSGHDVGDIALRMLAESLREELRIVDSAARFGGDEFAVILPQAATDGALIVAERLRRRIANTRVPRYGAITASFGIASFPVHASSRDALVVAADRALYRSKRFGRNQVNTPPGESFESADSNEDSFVEIKEAIVEQPNPV